MKLGDLDISLPFLPLLFVAGAALGGCSSSSGSASPADAGAAAAPGTCMPGSAGPCTSYTTPMGDSGTTIQLGPYGALAEANVGKGFENQIQMGDTPGSTYCKTFIDGVFAPNAEFSAQVDQILTGKAGGITLNYALYTVYRPATWPSTPVPVITWGNGTCAPPESYGALLRYVASYGFFVVAANSREVGSGSPAPMLRALDFAEAANKDSKSPYYGKLDMTKVGAMGHSQGAMATATAASDSRILDIILFNGGDTSSKPYMAVSGDTDLTFYTPSAMAAAVDASTVPAAWLYFHQIDVIGRSFSGHLTLQTQPERVAEPAKDWFQMMLQDSGTAQAEFTGTSCGLCGDGGAQEYGENNLP
ncbi:MAG: hypothetical protein ACRENE_01660 [Polyangiaceae bacterium]